VLAVDDLALRAESNAAAVEVLRRRAQLRAIELDGIADEHARH
jgi:hypothetical protein